MYSSVNVLPSTFMVVVEEFLESIPPSLTSISLVFTHHWTWNPVAHSLFSTMPLQETCRVSESIATTSGWSENVRGPKGGGQRQEARGRRQRRGSTRHGDTMLD